MKSFGSRYSLRTLALFPRGVGTATVTYRPLLVTTVLCVYFEVMWEK